ncbi:MAG: asparaginase domain-containing protein, partial [Candidatus Micrarchaeota archaeon]
YSAAAVAFMLGSVNKPVLFTAAQRSADRGSFDGSLNLVCAAHFVSSGFKGVAVVMHGSSSDDYCLVHNPTKVRKMHSSRRDAFRSVNDKPLAKVFADGRIEKMREWTDYGCSRFIGFDEKIALVKAHPCADPSVLEFYAKQGIRGVIIEAMGLGHVPTHSKKSWISSVKQLVRSGVFVGVTTQTLYGRVNPKVYANLRELESAGAVFLKDMLPETALVKLGWVLAQEKKLDGITKKMLELAAGEFNDRLTDGEFLN